MHTWCILTIKLFYQMTNNWLLFSPWSVYRFIKSCWRQTPVLTSFGCAVANPNSKFNGSIWKFYLALKYKQIQFMYQKKCLICAHMARLSNKSRFSIIIRPLWSRQEADSSTAGFKEWKMCNRLILHRYECKTVTYNTIIFCLLGYHVTLLFTAVRYLTTYDRLFR